MSDVDRFAKAIRKRDNPAKIGAQIGKVIGINPFVVELGNGKIHGEEGKNLFVADHLKKGYERVLRVNPTTVLYTTQEFDLIAAGDYVIVIASDNNQVLYVIGKV